MQHRTDAQWLETFAHYLETQQHVRVRLRGTETEEREAVVTQITPHGVHLSQIFGGEHHVAFKDIAAVRRIGDAAIEHDAHVVRYVEQITRAMAYDDYLRIESRDARLDTAQAREVTIRNVTVVDRAYPAGIKIPFSSIVNIGAVSATIPPFSQSVGGPDASGAASVLSD